jgi:hypothetical protein
MKLPLHLAQALLAVTLLTGAQSQTAEETSAPRVAGLDSSLQAWRSEHGPAWTMRTDRGTGHMQMLFGGTTQARLSPPVGDEQGWIALAREWVASTVALHGIEGHELPQGRFVYLPLGMARGTDKISVSFEQAVGGLPVAGGRVNVLMNTHGQLLSVHSTGAPSTRGLPRQPAISGNAARSTARLAFERSERVPAMEVGLPLLRIAQVSDAGLRRAVLAYSVTVSNEYEPLGFEYTLDATTGEVLERATTIHFFDVTGTLVSWATPGTEADHPGNPEVQIPMSYVNLSSSAGTVQTDRFGNFTFPGVTTPLNITASYNGTFNNVNNQAGSDYSITFNNVQPGQANTLVMNPAKTEYVTAGANAYQHINVVRDYIRDTVPSDNTADFKATSNTNINSSCNAYYNGNSVNFYRKASNCNNTAFSSVVAHEYGHWLNSRYGTGNGSDGMGEGNSDVFAMYPYDDPVVGRYFFTSGGYIRTGLNTRQYCGDGNGGCYGSVHNDGEVWMGAAWKVRRNLKATLGSSLGGATSDGLFINWMNAYNQSTIDSIIEVQWLTLDDDDGNIGNGTPNFSDIDSGFREQGFPGYDLDVLQFTNVTDLPDVPADVGPYSVNADVVALISPPVVNVDIHYQINGSGYLTVPMTPTGGDGFTGQIPAIGGTGFIDYYLTGSDSNGQSETYPSGGAAAPLDFVVGVEQTLAFWDFEAGNDEGWTGGLPGDDATTGQWERNDPNGTAAQPANDTTPSPGVNCWFTGQQASSDLGGNDVDGGTTTLLSPVLDMTGFSGVRVIYQRWYSNDEGASPNADTFLIGLSNDGGASWMNAETVGPTGTQASGGWFNGGFVLDTILPLTAQMQIRFRASDLGSGSIVEAAVDDVSITYLDAGCATPQNYCVGAQNSLGLNGMMQIAGSQKISDNNFTLLGINLPANTFGLFIYSDTTNQVPVGDGFLCLGGSIVRLPVTQSDFLGQMTLKLDFTNLPDMGPISAGDTRHFQCWYRDSGFGSAGYNFTDGISVPFCD